MAIRIRRPTPRYPLPATCPVTLTERRKHLSMHILIVVFLALGVPSFFAHARRNWYVSPTGNFEVTASQTKVSDVCVHAVQPLPCQVAAFARPQFDEHTLNLPEDVPLHPTPSVTLSLQDRAPPRHLA